MDERERETGFQAGFQIQRLLHDGRVHRWSLELADWPGHTAFVALKGGEVVVGDRYASEGVERTYSCDPASLLEGCFQELVAKQLGPRVLEELLAEVRRELGIAARPGGTGVTPSAPEAATAASKASKAASGASAPASAGASRATAAKVVSAPAQPGPASAVGSERPSAAPAAAPAGPAAAATSTVSAARVDLTVVACRSVSLPLAVTLRGITRTSVHELLARLRALPCRVAAGVPREQAEGLAARLAELGAEVRLVPAGGS